MPIDMYRIWQIKMNDVTITGDCRRNNLVTVFKLGLKQAVEEFDFDVFISFFFIGDQRDGEN